MVLTALTSVGQPNWELHSPIPSSHVEQNGEDRPDSSIGNNDRGDGSPAIPISGLHFLCILSGLYGVVYLYRSQVTYRDSEYY